MNKRIDALIGKSLDKAVPYTWHHLNRVQIDDTMKEFAELLVRECANIAFDEYAKTNGAESGESAILEHFGVDK